MRKINSISVILCLMILVATSSVVANNGDIKPAFKIEKQDRAPLKLLDARYSVEDGKLIIKGKVKNTRSRVTPGIFVVAKFYDLAGRLIETKEKRTVGSVNKLKGSRESKYTIKLDYNPKIVLCKLEVDWQRGE